jgi:[protein-PII] uridylyltransferase
MNVATPHSDGDSFLSTGDSVTALAERTASVDGQVVQAAAELLFPAAPGGVAILAVGGYGRRQLFPHSDVDLLLLFESERLAVANKEAISAFLQRLWDSRMRVSHSVRTPAECIEVHDRNAELNISLLDQRYLTGDRALYGRLAEKLPRFVQANRDPLIRNLAQLTRERHTRFADTYYHLEPNVKEAPGGMRDHQLICWLSQIHNTDVARLGWADTTPELDLAFRFLARLRIYLHCQSGRDNNVLSFDAQDALAEHGPQGDAARWMREYYRHARAIYRAAIRALEANEAPHSSLLAQFRDWRGRLSNSDFSVHRERAHFRAPQRLDVEPELALRLFEFVARHGIRPSAEAEERVEARHDEFRKYFAEPRNVWPALNRILTLPNTPLAVRAMHDTGMLTALLPELDQIECLVVRDFFHRYTVDEHTLVSIQKLCDLQGTRPFGDLLAEVDRPGVLAFALLFHDAGKGDNSEGHIAGSLRFAETAMRRLQMPEPDRETVRFLILRHLDLSAAMQGRDIHDPQTILELAHQVQTVENLRALTLLTYADISAVNTTVMTPWRADQLWQLYLTVYNELTRELETERIEEVPSGPPERVEFLKGFPTRYLRTHTEAQIEADMALEERSRKRGVVVDIRKSGSVYVLTLAATDRPGLFAAVAGALASFGMNILKAEAYANRRGIILDTFTFADPMRTLELNSTEVDRLRVTVERVISGKADIKALLRNRRKPAPPSRKATIETTISFDGDASGTATLVEVVAEDRPGLLYDLTSTISGAGCNIEVVLIDTEAHKAIDVFYITAGGKKLDKLTQESLRNAMRQAAG